MAKTQTITFKKAGTSWATQEEARADMLAAIDATAIDTDDLITNKFPNMSNTFITNLATLDGQTYTVVRTFSTDEDYTAYKNDISSLEPDVSDALIADGWEITDTVE